MSIIRKWLNKLWFIFVEKYYEVIFLNESNLYQLMWMEFCNELLNKKNQDKDKHKSILLVFLVTSIGYKRINKAIKNKTILK